METVVDPRAPMAGRSALRAYPPGLTLLSLLPAAIVTLSKPVAPPQNQIAEVPVNWADRPGSQDHRPAAQPKNARQDSRRALASGHARLVDAIATRLLFPSSPWRSCVRRRLATVIGSSLWPRALSVLISPRRAVDMPRRFVRRSSEDRDAQSLCANRAPTSAIRVVLVQVAPDVRHVVNRYAEPPANVEDRHLLVRVFRPVVPIIERHYEAAIGHGHPRRDDGGIQPRLPVQDP